MANFLCFLSFNFLYLCFDSKMGCTREMHSEHRQQERQGNRIFWEEDQKRSPINLGGRVSTSLPQGRAPVPERPSPGDDTGGTETLRGHPPLCTGEPEKRCLVCGRVGSSLCLVLVFSFLFSQHCTLRQFQS